ncbi:MAG: 2,3-bisphosphoglycerate-independent phosphoglycerate mutase [Dissulfurimicrobium sp.]|uniref:2,3-bisphosphoglycerate-independent phosphoglycerate mutase n=1 Tax=Dissulfurimicrobium TaxID=1769732 RepID=UPI001EDA608B|nr:2,3-bisphosphoglycerate-independent phosphoglycerate mutase [Dissulfurimicrobium hydrothermale]UKL14138.1 2,3-bisphosphoglycerate-independent phosphoglycerate mutase [Dissulfurimicrobium hydrothermale]
MKNDIRPVMLIIMDGWGWREDTEGNAVRLANTPNLDRFYNEYPFTLLTASGEAVGLPAGQMGNSEVGHLNLGAGRIVYQELTRIDKTIRDGSFFENKTLVKIMDEILHSGHTLHLMGLVSDGGVHSQIGHLFALLKMARDRGLAKVCVHAFLDGRDTLPSSGAGYMRELVAEMDRLGSGKIATIIGRYYAMDRDKRWERVEAAYKALVKGEGRRAKDPVAAIETAYAMGETDEFIRPVVLEDERGEMTPRIGRGDGVIFFNFRADRARQLTRAFIEPGFSEFNISDRPLISFVTMTLYDEGFNSPVAFPPQHLSHILGEEVAAAGLKQLRIAETEKYAHVTYFFNGGEETPFHLEERVLIPSPREVATYDLKPEMSAFKIKDELIKRITENDYALIVVNFANGDMVGHTGVLQAAVTACEVVDRCVGELTDVWTKKDGAALITADHGNVEVMLAPDGGPSTTHTTNPVPFYMIDSRRRGARLSRGILADVAPTALTIMGLPLPDAMTGKILFE